MRKSKPMELPTLTAEQWLEAFRRTENVFGQNKSRMWVLRIMRDYMNGIVEGQ